MMLFNIQKIGVFICKSNNLLKPDVQCDLTCVWTSWMVCKCEQSFVYLNEGNFPPVFTTKSKVWSGKG